MTEAHNCGNCQATLKRGARFCTDCGLPVPPCQDATEAPTPDVLSEVQAKTSSGLLGTLANVLFVFSGILIVFMVIDLASSWIFKFDITGNPASALFAGILASILGFLGRQLEKGRASGSALRTLLSFIFGIIGVIIFGGFVWGVVNWSGLLGDRGLFPDHFANKYYNSGTEYLEQEQYEQAIENLDEAIRLDPEYQSAYFNRGIAYRDLGLYKQAILDFDSYIGLDPDDSDAYFNRAYAYDALGLHQFAIEDLDEVIRLDPGYADAYHNRGVAYEAIGNAAAAARDFQKAEELASDPP